MTMKTAALALFGFLLSFWAAAQKYSVEKSYVKFFSSASLEDITAENTKSSGLFNESTGEVAFSIPIKEFEFDKSLMKEHFNEKYMESEKFPKAIFQGKIEGYNAGATGSQAATAIGKMTIHGISQEVQIPGTFEKLNGKVIMKAKFMVKLEDYKVKIPQLLWKNIAEQVQVTVEFNYSPL
jgi:polyisoprenoid-binding protein YceI